MPKNKKSLSQKGIVSNVIAWIFIVLQTMLILGGLYAGGPREPIAFFYNLEAAIQSIVFVLGMNILGIGALILGLIVWRYYYNPSGKVTIIVAITIIVLNVLCNCSLVG